MRQLNSSYLCLIAMGFGLGGCASGPTIHTNQNPAIDFTNFRTYSYVEQMGTDAPGGPTSLLTQFLQAAVDREMAGRGYELSGGDTDLQINFYVETQEKIQSRQVPSGPTYGGGYYGYRGGYYGTWGGYSQTTEITQYTEGTLSIDVVDRARNELIWEAVVVGRVRESLLANLEERVNEVVPEIMADYPYRVPPPPAE